MARRGPLAPVLRYVPSFVSLHAYPRSMVAAYGAIAAFQAHGHHPTVREIAFAARISQTRHAARAIARLVKADLVRRRNVGDPRSRVRYELLGETLKVERPDP